MNFVLCSNLDDTDEILQHATHYFDQCHFYPKVEVFREKQEFLAGMENRQEDIILIAWTKAKGMEIVRQTAEKNNRAKVIWISDDEDFVRFAREHHVCYFTVKHDEEAIENALEACGITPTDNYYYGNI